MEMEKQAESETSLDDLSHSQIWNRIENYASSFGESGTDGSERSERSSDTRRHPLSVTELQVKRTAAVSKRWTKLSKGYNDHYADLFRTTFDGSLEEDGIPAAKLPPTQLGAVSWTPLEKRKLFSATARKGRLDISGIAEAIGSKSQLEVQEYLKFLQKEERDSHLFARHVNSISHADIPAAVEVSGEVEKALEEAADALASYQDQFDLAAVSSKDEAEWVIDREAAKDIDALMDGEASSEVESEEVPDSARLFQLSKLIELSERLFMHPESAGVESDWLRVKLKYERPGVTSGVLVDFHNLVVNVTRKLVQTALFLAQSRLRSIRVQGTSARALLRRQDVTAASDVLNMSIDSWDYWVGIPRRNKLKVISGSHRKGSTRKQLYSYDGVENALAQRTPSGFRKSQSMTTEESSDEGSEINTENELPSTEDNRRQHQPSPEPSPNATSETSGSSNNTAFEDKDVDDEEDEAFSFHVATSEKKRRQILLDAEQDQLLEQLDQAASRREEVQLWQVLGRDPEKLVDEEASEEMTGPRPKVLRKTQANLRDWVGRYEAQWELFGALVPRESFMETEQRRKRRRVRLYQP